MTDAQHSTSKPTAFLLFGATGDLARRLVLPAFYRLANVGALPEDWRLIGNGRGDVSHEDFRAKVKSALEEFAADKPEGPVWEDFEKRVFFAGKGFDKDTPGLVLDVLKEVAEPMGDYQLVHYFGVPPQNFAKLTEGVKAHELVEGSKVVFEKPYGEDQQSFYELNELVQSVFDEEQVYRIDHFLGKEGAQNLHTARFANVLFEHLWNREFVEAVQIDIPEVLNVDDRASFYDETGAFNDMIVTHLFQLAAEAAMEPPVSMRPDDVQTARESVIAAFRPLAKDDVVLGQFDGYLDIEGIPEGSKTETFVAAKLWIDTDRWEGVPFLLRTGKMLKVSDQRVTLILRKPEGPVTHVPDAANAISFVLRGNGAIEISFLAKKPGVETELSKVSVRQDLGDIDGALNITAYSRLIHDVLAGEKTLFTHPDGLEHAWKVVQPLLDDRPDVVGYEPGSWGPKEALDLAAPHGWQLSD